MIAAICPDVVLPDLLPADEGFATEEAIAELNELPVVVTCRHGWADSGERLEQVAVSVFLPKELLCAAAVAALIEGR